MNLCIKPDETAPLPWSKKEHIIFGDKNFEILDANKRYLGWINPEDAADKMLKMVNSHTALVEALTKALKGYDWLCKQNGLYSNLFADYNEAVAALAAAKEGAK